MILVIANTECLLGPSNCSELSACINSALLLKTSEDGYYYVFYQHSGNTLLIHPIHSNQESTCLCIRKSRDFMIEWGCGLRQSGSTPYQRLRDFDSTLPIVNDRGLEGSCVLWLSTCG